MASPFLLGYLVGLNVIPRRHQFGVLAVAMVQVNQALRQADYWASSACPLMPALSGPIR